MSTARREECKAFVVAGDLFDHVRPEPQLIAAVSDCFAEFATELEIFVLLGNHDVVSAAPGDHALGPLRALPHVVVVEHPRVFRVGDLELELLPYRSAPVDEWLAGELACLKIEAARRVKEKRWKPTDRRVLCLHAGVRDAATPPWLKDASDAVNADVLAAAMADNRIGVAVAGNWHDHRAWEFTNPGGVALPGPRIVQAGALVPTGFDNPGLDGYGSVIVTAGVDWVRHEVPGPRFLAVTDQAEYSAAAKRVRPGMLFVRQKAPATQVAAVAVQLADDELHLGLGGVEAVPDVADQRAHAQAAATAAQQAGGALDASVRAFVGAMALEGGVDRDAVAARALAYLAC